MARELDGHAGRIWLGDIAVAVSVQVGNESPFVTNPRGPLVGWKARGVELVGVRLVILLGGGIVDGRS